MEAEGFGAELPLVAEEIAAERATGGFVSLEAEEASASPEEFETVELDLEVGSKPAAAASAEVWFDFCESEACGEDADTGALLISMNAPIVRRSANANGMRRVFFTGCGLDVVIGGATVFWRSNFVVCLQESCSEAKFSSKS
jgi:hypothetical protein